MLLVKTQLGKSTIHGIGYFASEPIKKDTLIWVFVPGFDQAWTKEEILALPKPAQEYLYRYMWKSVRSGLYCLSGGNDRFVNHSDTPNTRIEIWESQPEVLIFANENIAPGSEITSNYFEFDDIELGEDNLWKTIRDACGIPMDDFDRRLEG